MSPSDKHSVPPKWPLKLLRLFIKKRYLEEIEGDMEERFQDNLEAFSVKKARRLYAWDTIKLLRATLVKSLSGDIQLNHYGMFKNYLKTSVRNIKRHALFSGINIIGLAISMSIGIFMIVLLSELQSFDAFHDKKDRTYRVTTSRQGLFHGEETYLATASHYIGDQIEHRIPEVEDVLVLRRKLSAELTADEKSIPTSGYYATASFFDVFSFKLLKGNPKTALKTPGAIILTASTAKRLFRDSDPIGKTVGVDGNSDFETGIITGIVEDPPTNSHITFEMLVSMATMENSLVEHRRNIKGNHGHYADSYVYLVLQEDADIVKVESMIADMLADHNSRKAPMTLALEPMGQFVIGGAGFPPGPTFLKRRIDMMIGLTIIVLLSACFNYTNLSLARALRRSKEISVRKVIGGTSLQIFSQFILEAVLLSSMAVILGLGLFFLIKPGFLNLPELSIDGTTIFTLNVTPIHLVYYLLFTLFVGTIAGFFPALTLSKLKATVLFKGASKMKLLSGVNTRQALITFQFALSIGLIVSAMMVHGQYQYLLNYDLGYDTDNIVNIKIQGDYMDLLENEYVKMSEVLGTSRSSVVLGTRNAELGEAFSEDKSDMVMFSTNYIGQNYLNMHEFELIAGTGFQDHLKEGQVQNTLVVNETFLKELNLGDPYEAIGKSIWYFGEQKMQIQGVVKDFISMSLDAEVPKAFAFVKMGATNNGILGVKVESNHLWTTMAKLEKAYKELDPVHPFQATFYDDEIASTYAASKTTYSVISFLALLAISISTLGLLGMTVYTTEGRMKEISIRKVLGAGINSLMLLLSRGFLIMIVLAAVMAIPGSLYIVNNMILSKFLYKAEMGLIETLSGFIIILLIGVLTVGWQVRTATTQNPAELLRNE
ncbi:MAG: ABC transporter permease [Bacteroidota bacterium]